VRATVVRPSPAGRLVRQPPIGVVRRRRQALLSWASPAAETPRFGGKQSRAEGPAGRVLFVVAVAQTSCGLTEAFLRAGSKKPQVLARPRRARFGLGAAMPLSNRLSERGPGFRNRLCATATTTSTRPVPGPRHARFGIADAESGSLTRARRDACVSSKGAVSQDSTGTPPHIRRRVPNKGRLRCVYPR
jgi:hypothetical protein